MVQNEICPECDNNDTEFIKDVGHCVEIWYCKNCKENFEA